MTARRIALLAFAAVVIGAAVYGLLLERGGGEIPVVAAIEDVPHPNDEEAAAAHILIAHVESEPPRPGVTRSRVEARELASRITALLLSRAASFKDLARRYSDDPNAERNAGYLGIFKRDQLPLALEVPLFDLEVGEFNPHVETGRGIHILMRQPVRRAVASHILITWSGARNAHAGVRRTREQAAQIAAEVDAMYRTGETDFCDLAARFSDDAESRFRCGLIGQVEPATLPPALEAELFALGRGEVSGVVETGFGFHLLRREDG